MTIDIHAHSVPEGLIRDLAREVPAAAPTLSGSGRRWFMDYPGGRRSGPMPAGMFDLGDRLAEMDRTGVDVQALSVPPTHFYYRLEPRAAAAAVRLHNDAMIADARAHPDRLVVLGSLPMQDVELAQQELERLIAIPEVVGLELATNVAGVNLGVRRHDALWSAIDASGLAVVLHPNDVAGGERMQDHFLHNFVGNPTDSTLAAGSLIFGGVLARNSALRFALLHGGGFLPYQIGRFDHGWKVRPEAREQLDEAPSTYLDRFFFDTLTHDPASLRFLHDRVGSERLAMGSDYPFDMADADPVGSVRAVFADEPDVLSSVLETTPRELLTRRPPR